MGASIPIPLGRCLGVASRAAPGSPPGPGCSLLTTPCGAESASPSQCLNSLLAVPGGRHVQQAMGHILTAPVDVLVQAGQHRTLEVASWKFRPPTYQQCPIIDCPHEVLKMAGVIHIQQGQGIQHAHPLHPMPPLSASQCREAQNLVSYHALFIQALLPLHLIEDIEKLIRSIQQHLQPVTIVHHLLVMQGAGLHAGSLECGDTCVPLS